MTLSLIFDTSTERGIIGLLKDDSFIYEKQLPFGLQSSKFLIPTIDQCFSTLGLKPGDLTYIAVGIGPGSYTGIRVAAMTAKVMTYALKIPLIGYCTLDGFVPEEDGSLAAIIDAKIGGAYVKTGIKKNGLVQFHSEAQLLPLEKLESVLDEAEILVTPQASPLNEKLARLYPQKTFQWTERWPSLPQIAHIVTEKWSQGQYSTDGALNLLYLRATQAEIELNAKRATN